MKTEGEFCGILKRYVTWIMYFNQSRHPNKLILLWKVAVLLCEKGVFLYTTWLPKNNCTSQKNISILEQHLNLDYLINGTWSWNKAIRRSERVDIITLLQFVSTNRKFAQNHCNMTPRVQQQPFPERNNCTVLVVNKPRYLLHDWSINWLTVTHSIH